MQTAIVVGSGVAGLLSAILLKEKYREVYLIEQSRQIGGLLRSYQNESGDWFDHGTHLISGTAIPEIDAIILNNNWTKKWQHFPYERAGTYFKGRLNQGCVFVDTKDIGKNYGRGLSDLLEITAYPKTFENARTQLEGIFGQTFTNEIFAPILENLFCVDSLHELLPDAHLRFSMKRLQMLNTKATALIKQIPIYDDRISYKKYTTTVDNRTIYYPYEGGANEWVREFEKELKQLGVHILCEQSVEKVHHKQTRVESVILANGKVLSCNKLVWTVPTVFLFKAAGIEFRPQPPRRVCTSLFHYTIDNMPLAKDWYIFCYDPKVLAFRVTLYSNLQPDLAEKSGRHRITVEVLTADPLNFDEATQKIFDELIEMGIVAHDANILYQKALTVPMGFPILDHSYQKIKQNLRDTAQEHFSNVVFAGKDSLDAWFMPEVFKEVYKKLT